MKILLFLFILFFNIAHAVPLEVVNLLQLKEGQNIWLSSDVEECYIRLVTEKVGAENVDQGCFPQQEYDAILIRNYEQNPVNGLINSCLRLKPGGKGLLIIKSLDSWDLEILKKMKEYPLKKELPPTMDGHKRILEALDFKISHSEMRRKTHLFQHEDELKEWLEIALSPYCDSINEAFMQHYIELLEKMHGRRNGKLVLVEKDLVLLFQKPIL